MNEQEVSRIYNSAIAAAAISTACELGIFDAFRQGADFDVRSFCDAGELHAGSVRAVLRALACFDIITFDEQADAAARGRLFDVTFRQKGYFLWLVRGYGELWQNLARLAQTGNRPADPQDHRFLPRDGHWIAVAGRDYGGQFVDHHVKMMLAEQPPRVVADLGCGSAARIIDLVQENPGLRAVGVDRELSAVALARKNVHKLGLQDRISILHGDVSNLQPEPELAEVDACLCFFMGHDLWPREPCRQALLSLRDALPNVRRFLFGDTYRSEAPPATDIPTFALGFEITHAVMGQYIPTESEWLSLFGESGWDCRGTRDLDIPFSTIFDLRPSALLASHSRPQRTFVSNPASDHTIDVN